MRLPQFTAELSIFRSTGFRMRPAMPWSNDGSEIRLQSPELTCCEYCPSDLKSCLSKCGSGFGGSLCKALCAIFDNNCRSNCYWCVK
jgi:hypothetical protein